MSGNSGLFPAGNSFTNLVLQLKLSESLIE